MAVDNPRFVKGKKRRQYHAEKLPSISLFGHSGHHRKNGGVGEEGRGRGCRVSRQLRNGTV